MTHRAIFASLALLSTSHGLAEEPQLGIEGMLGFINGDQLHGQYLGFSENGRVLWQRDDLAEPAAFEREKIRRLILRAGKPASGLAVESYIVTASGDTMPGRIVSLDEEKLTLDTGFAGLLTIPRRDVATLVPSPIGGRIKFHGPFSSDEWQINPIGTQSEDSPEDDPDDA